MPVLAARAQTLTVGAAPPLLRINVAVPGAPPSAVTGTSSYTVKAQNKNKAQKVTARLNAAMPAGVTLTIELTAPTGATTMGPVALDATARDLVGNIVNTTAEVETITYTLSATAAAGVVTAQTRTVTFTITNWP